MSTDEQSKKFYTEKAKQYTEHVRNPLDSVYHSYYEKPAMYKLLPDLQNKTVLSIGCGSGEDSIYLKRQGAMRSVGIDLSENLIDIATTSYSECEFKVMDMEKLDFPSETFDFVYSSLAIHYVEDWKNVFIGVHKILKSGGSFLFSCSHPVRFAMDEDNSQEGFSARKLEIARNEATKELKITGDYLVKRKIIDALGKDTANIWTMPISDIVRTAIGAGFVIEDLVEPRPLDEMKVVNAREYYRLSKIPEFVIFKLLKH